MNISSLFSFSTLNPWSKPGHAAQAVDNPSPLAQAVQRADLRLQGEVQANTAQLSAFGQLKSSLSELQLSAQSLEGVQAIDATSVQDLVARFNGTLGNARSSSALPGDAAAAQSARRIAAFMLSTVQGDTQAQQALTTAGITLQDGRLNFDSTAPQATESATDAVQQLAQRLNAAATQELASNGEVSYRFDQLLKTARQLDSQQDVLMSAAQATSAQLSGQRQQGLAAYRAHGAGALG